MALWDKIKKKEENNPNLLKKEVLNDKPEENKIDYEKIGKEIIYTINTAFGVPKEVIEDVVKDIDLAISENIGERGLDYEKLIEMVCHGCDDKQAEKYYGHQLLGAYVAYTLMTGKPLKLK
jgi:hypothetical protein